MKQDETRTRRIPNTPLLPPGRMSMIQSNLQLSRSPPPPKLVEEPLPTASHAPDMAKTQPSARRTKPRLRGTLSR